MELLKEEYIKMKCPQVEDEATKNANTENNTEKTTKDEL